jgi:energy-coupling factor transporter ATP-binding protein EcfA2
MQIDDAIAQALIVKPPVLLMDEAFSALDPSTRRGMQKLMRELWQESGMTVVFVTHNTREAVCLGSRVVVLAKQGERGSSVALDVQVPHLNFRFGRRGTGAADRQGGGSTLPFPMQQHFQCVLHGSRQRNSSGVDEVNLVHVVDCVQAMRDDHLRGLGR